ncbi:LamG-like jellyroll fold domain-containing protein [Chitinophaga filiformis]|uniref:Por secretion system C-terminal sorting domain-containing protein n=1 Tax=Chitinophaga filiformis TaxID=104663 RepID=A0A1G7Y4M7_CHIFI|nr:LamG-like jellyroll fold domain-containing protein [Chitinophaga filiformis]SDG91418.1 Por secretion system C-terminal sorting domain-containing protein [Chitinophaga filiformis]
MKKITKQVGRCLTFCILLSSLTTFVNAQVIAKKVTASTGQVVPFLQSKPSTHDASLPTRKYPLIIFLHGGGALQSNDTSLLPGAPVWNLTGWGPMREVGWQNNNLRATWNNKTDTFIVLQPLGPTTTTWPTAYIDAMVKYGIDSLKVDTCKIYLSGHSWGGAGVFNYLNSSSANAKKLAAVVPISAWNTALNSTGAANVSAAKLPVWAFHAYDDVTTSRDTTINSINRLNAVNPQVKPLLTIWPAGTVTPHPHNTAPEYVFSIHAYPFLEDGVLNIYEWFLGQNKCLAVNTLPVAHAGNDTTISASSGTATLNGSTSTDADGTIVRYVWKKYSGPAGGSIATPSGTGSSTTVSGLTTAGIYKYQLSVVDDRAAIARDSMTVTVTSGSPGNAVTFSSLGRITTGDVTQLKNVSTFTLEAHFKYDATVSTWTTIMRKGISLTDRIMLHIGPNDNSIYVMVGNGANSYGYTAANAVSPGNWYHVAAVYDGTQTGDANRLKLYIDGVQQILSFSSSPIPASTSNTNTAPFMAGGEPSCCYLNGTIDEVRVWSTPLSAGTITAWKDKLLTSCHPNVANLVVYWPLDNDATATTATAALGTAYTGTISNGSYVESDQVIDTSGCGNAVTVSSSGRITTGNVTQLNNASKFTLEAHFKYDATVSTWTTIMRKATSLTDRIMLHIGPNNNSIYFMVGNGSNTYGFTGANAVSPGGWYHIAAVFDGTQTGDANRLKVYIDGVQQTLSFSATAIPANTSTTNTAPFMAGGEPSCCYVNGTIDEVRVWNTALSAGTIDAWKDKLLGSCHPNAANLIVYWPLDNNANPGIATAELGTAYTGTITNSSYVSSDQVIAPDGCSGARPVFVPPLEEIKQYKPVTGKVYPNPTEGFIQLELNSSIFKPVTVNVHDMFGRSLYSHKTSIVKGFNRISLNIRSLPAGVYIVEVKDGNVIMEKYKVLKQ